MKHAGIPSFYFPTTAVFVDDSKDFLINLSLQFDPSLSYHLIESPQEALQFIQNHQQCNPANRGHFSTYTDAIHNPLTSHTINFDVAAIHQAIYNEKRFTEISVLFVDYSMPGINGLELCRMLEDHPCKKVLLTGQADEKMAVQAFNEGLIDHFILKNNPDVIQVMNDTLHDLQQRYFLEQSDMLTRALSSGSLGFLKDPTCVSFFQSLCKQHNIVEYYLTETSGSFLLLDAKGTPSWLVVKNEEDVIMLSELAQDNNVANDIIARIKMGEILPFFGTLGNDICTANWSAYLYPANQLAGQAKYYYALVQNPIVNDLTQANISAYDAYLETNDIPA